VTRDDDPIQDERNDLLEACIITNQCIAKRDPIKVNISTIDVLFGGKLGIRRYFFVVSLFLLQFSNGFCRGKQFAPY
jgi:hypothetical protein